MIILDTHIWLWWLNQDIERLGIRRLNLIEETKNIGVSAISCFEVAWLEKHNRIQLLLKRDVWFSMALEGSNIKLLPITPEISNLAVDLPEHHNDPQDRIIIATTISLDAKIISSDQKFKLYQELNDRLF